MTDHPDLIALRAAVLAAPADDVPRLAYADRLEELDGTMECVRREAYWFGSRHVIPHPRPRRHSSAIVLCPDCSGTGRVPNGYAERAEFIRLQCELAAADWRKCGGYYCQTYDTGNVMHVDCQPERLRLRESKLWPLVVGSFDLPGGGWLVDIHPRGTDRSALVRRGFVSHVTCPLAAWLGERCENCGGDGEFTRQNSDGPPGPCPDCGGKWNSGPHCDTDSYWDRGTGYVGGVAAAVCAGQPVEVVTLSDREPNDYGPPEDGRRFGWVRQSHVWQLHQPFALPPVLYDRLRDLSDWNDGRHPTRAAALDALGAVALAVGKGWAKLVATK